MLSASSSNSGSHKQTTSLFSEERHDSAISQIDLLPNDKLGTSPPPPPPPPPPASIMQQAQPPPSVPPPTPPEAKAANAGANKGSNPEDWSIDQVAEWLQSVGLSNVADNFIGTRNCMRGHVPFLINIPENFRARNYRRHITEPDVRITQGTRYHNIWTALPRYECSRKIESRAQQTNCRRRCCCSS